MSWYMAVLVRGSFVEDALDENRLGDMLFKLIEAPDAESAYNRAIGIGQASADDYTEDDGTAVRFGFLGLADLREIGSAPIGDGTEFYSELIPTKPSRRVVEKESLTLFEPAEEPEWYEDVQTEAEVEAEAPSDDRFKDGTPIR